MLTDLKIKNTMHKSKPYRLADMNGLYLQIMPNGGKLWRWNYKLAGKAQTASFGKYPLVTLSDARKKLEAAKLLVMQGKHPTREKKAEKLKQSFEGENTFQSVALRWLEIKQIGLNEKYARQSIERMKQHVFPIIGGLPVTEIKTPTVVSTRALFLSSGNNVSPVNDMTRIRELKP